MPASNFSSVSMMWSTKSDLFPCLIWSRKFDVNWCIIRSYNHVLV